MDKLKQELQRVERKSISRRRANADRVKYDGTTTGKVHGSLLHLQIDFQEQHDEKSEDLLCELLDDIVRKLYDR